ncbi:MAG: cyclic nucleotide-binding domain-containing protein [Treponema sp.]|nr:cyclic nucleotide-binding domain-containing protein [Treponema sp.]
MVDAGIDSKLIQKTELFTGMTQSEIDFITAHSQMINLPKDNLLFSSGEKASCFYILASGEIRVYKKKDDQEEEMAYFSSGDTIGDFDFARGAEYDACAEAAQDSQLIVFPGRGSTLDSLANMDPGTICSILLKAILMMTERIKSTNRLVLDKMSWVQNIHRRAYEDAGTGLWKQTLIADEILGALKDPAALIMVKPDRFKILVDSRGHLTGDETMIRIAIIVKNITRGIGHGWPMRFKSNEVGIIINNSNAAEAKKVAEQLLEEIAAMEPVPAMDDFPEFKFSATISWTIWPVDDPDWENLYHGANALLLDNWRAGGARISHYSKTEGI